MGVLGANAYLVFLLLFDKKIDILKNDILDWKIMWTFFILFGGVLATAVNLPGYPNFGAGQFMIAFTAGFGWPGIVAGISASKRVGDISEEREQIREVKDIFKKKDEKRTLEVENLIKSIEEKYEKNFKTITERAEKEKMEIESFYLKKLSSIGGI
jgi:hypothetical protein